MKNPNLKYSLPFRILGAASLLLVLPLILFSIFELRYVFFENVKDAKRALVEISNQKRAEFAELSDSKFLLLDEIAYLLNIPKLLPTLPDDKINTLFEEMAKIGDFWGLSIYKITGDNRFINVASQDGYLLGKDYTNSFQIYNILQKKRVNFLLYDERPPYIPLYTVAKLIESEEKPIAAFVMSFWMQERLKSFTKQIVSPFTFNFALLTKDKIVFDATDPALKFKTFEPISKERLKELENALIYGNYKIDEDSILKSPIPESTFFEFTLHGKRQIAYMTSVPEAQFFVLAYTAKIEIVRGVLKRFLALFTLYMVILLLGSAIVFFLTKKMAKPFEKLYGLIEDVKNHNLESRYTSDRYGFEINQLGEDFNEMIDSLKKYMHQAEEERAKRELIAQELRIGREVQKQLLPQAMPEYHSVEIADLYISAKEVGGDFYDVFIQESKEGKKLFLTIADTSGKGISACFYSLGVRSLLRSFGKEIQDLSEIVRLTNKNFYEDAADTGMFITAFVGTFDNKSGILNYFSCGHNPAIVRRTDGSVEFLKNHGIAIGLMEVTHVEEKQTKLNLGDMLVLYTDGLTEAHNEMNENYGISRLSELLQRKQDISANELVQSLIREVKTFTGTAPQHDDITLLVLKIVPANHSKI